MTNRERLIRTGVLGIAERTAQEYDQYLCPFHKEDTGSFTVYDDGRAYCFGCLKTQSAKEMSKYIDELEAAKEVHGHDEDFEEMAFGSVDYDPVSQTVVSISDVLDDLPELPPVEESEHSSSAVSHYKYGTPTHVFDYCDDTGKRVYSSMRFDYIDKKGKAAKTFLSCVYDEKGELSWGGTPKTNKLLYNGHTITDKTTTIFVVEGEKKADHLLKYLIRRGVTSATAVTCMNGASAAKRTDWAKVTGKNVYIWGDNDKPGDGYVEEVCAILAKNNKVSVFNRNVYPENTIAGYDVADMDEATITSYLIDKAAWKTTNTQQCVKNQIAKAEEKVKNSFSYEDFLLSLDNYYNVVYAKTGTGYVCSLTADNVTLTAYISMHSENWVGSIYLMLNALKVHLTDELIKRYTAMLNAQLQKRNLPVAVRRYYIADDSITVTASQDSVIYADSTGLVSKKTPESKSVHLWGSSSKPLLARKGQQSLKSYIDKYFSNISADARPCLAGWLVSAVFGKQANHSVPIALFLGGSGTGKSTCAAFIKEILDPDANDKTNIVNNARDMAVILHNCEIPLFDNVTNLNTAMSDFMCTVVTGGAHSERKKYSDADTSSLSIKSAVVMTALSLPTKADDLIDRLQLFVTNTPDDRTDYRTVIDEFKKDVPKMRHLVLSIAIRALTGGVASKTSLVQSVSDSRFGEHTSVSVFAALEAGYSQEQTVKSLGISRDATEDERASCSDFIGLLTDYIQEVSPTHARSWRVNPGDLHRHLLSKVPEEQRSTLEGFPKNAVHLSRDLRAATGILKGSGVKIEFTRISKSRFIVFRKMKHTKK